MPVCVMVQHRDQIKLCVPLSRELLWRGGFVRGKESAPHQQPRTQKTGVLCHAEKSPEQQVARLAGEGRFSARYSTTSLSERTSSDLFVRTVVMWGVFPCQSVQHHCIGTPARHVGRPNFILVAEEIHGKTGPAPSGAVLFGPFSLAKKKKGVK